MSDERPIPVSFELPKGELEKALNAVLQSKSNSLFAEIDSAIREKDADFRKQVDGLIKRLDGMSDKVETTKTRVEDSLDKLQIKVNTKVNTYVIPAVFLVFVAIVLGIFSMLGGFKVIGDVESLKGKVSTASQQYEEMNTKLGPLITQVNAAASKLETDRMLAYEKKQEEQAATLATILARLQEKATVTKKLDKTTKK